ncbi:MAG: YIP1 family protein [Bacteroidota bacterium]
MENLIQCAVCGHRNTELATVCKSCGAFLQNRPTALNLFETVWKLVDSPKRALREVALAEHKNHAWLLSIFEGIGLTYLSLAVRTADEMEATLGSSLLTGAIAGAIAGPIGVSLLSLILLALGLIFGQRLMFKNIRGVLTYALVPVVINLFTVFPLQIMTFGAFLFTHNPSPLTINPTVFIATVLIDLTFGIWQLFVLISALSIFFTNSFYKIFTSILILVLISAAAERFLLSPIVHNFMDKVLQ